MPTIQAWSTSRVGSPARLDASTVRGRQRLDAGEQLVPVTADSFRSWLQPLQAPATEDEVRARCRLPSSASALRTFWPGKRPWKSATRQPRGHRHRRRTRRPPSRWIRQRHTARCSFFQFRLTVLTAAKGPQVIALSRSCGAVGRVTQAVTLLDAMGDWIQFVPGVALRSVCVCRLGRRSGDCRPDGHVDGRPHARDQSRYARTAWAYRRRDVVAVVHDRRGLAVGSVLAAGPPLVEDAAPSILSGDLRVRPPSWCSSAVRWFCARVARNGVDQPVLRVE